MNMCDVTLFFESYKTLSICKLDLCPVLWCTQCLTTTPPLCFLGFCSTFRFFGGFFLKEIMWRGSFHVGCSDVGTGLGRTGPWVPGNPWPLSSGSVYAKSGDGRQPLPVPQPPAQASKEHPGAIAFTPTSGVSSVQSLSHVWLCDHMDCSMPGLPVHHQLLEFIQNHVHWVGDAIQPSHPLLSPSPAFNLSQYRGLFKWVRSSHQVTKVLEFQLQHQSFQWSSGLLVLPGLISFRMDWLNLLAVQGTLKSLLQHHSSKASILRRSAFFTVQLSHPYMTTRKNHSLD